MGYSFLRLPRVFCRKPYCSNWLPLFEITHIHISQHLTQSSSIFWLPAPNQPSESDRLSHRFNSSKQSDYCSNGNHLEARNSRHSSLTTLGFLDSIASSLGVLDLFVPIMLVGSHSAILGQRFARYYQRKYFPAFGCQPQVKRSKRRCSIGSPWVVSLGGGYVLFQHSRVIVQSSSG